MKDIRNPCGLLTVGRDPAPGISTITSFLKAPRSCFKSSAAPWHKNMERGAFAFTSSSPMNPGGRLLSSGLGSESHATEPAVHYDDSLRLSAVGLDAVYHVRTTSASAGQSENSADSRFIGPASAILRARRTGVSAWNNGSSVYEKSSFTQSGWLGRTAPSEESAEPDSSSVSSLAVANTVRALVHPLYVSALSGLRWLGTFRGVQAFRSRLLSYNMLNSDEAVERAVTTCCAQAGCEPVTPTLKSTTSVDRELRALINKLFVRHLSSDGRWVDYQALMLDKDFVNFVSLTRGLRDLDVLEMSRARRLAFFLNIYNALLIHAITILGRPRSFVARFRFFQTASYCIGGHLYSLNDIENGVLRGNRAPPYPFASKPFGEPGSGDIRAQAMITGGDPRIHFGLNCGARSCPPIRAYDESNVDQALEAATANFIRDNVKIVSENHVELSRIFLWYASDFGSNVIWWILKHWPLKTEEDMQNYRRIVQWVESGQLRITYSKYDWALNEVTENER
jgi:hypothetical protein